MSPVTRTLLALTLSMCLPSVAWGQTQGWDLVSATSTFLAESPSVAAERQLIGVAQAEVVGASVLPNPTIAADREQVFGAGDENRLSLQMPLPVSGKWGLRRDVARSGVTTAEARVRQRVLGLTLDFRAAYQRTHFADARAEQLASSRATYQRLGRIVSARTQAGESSGYDLHRLELERQSLEARLSNARAEAIEGRALVSSLWGRPVEGALRLPELPAPPPPLEELLAEARKRPEVQTLRAEMRLTEVALRLANRANWSDPELSLGIKQATEPTAQGIGYLAGVSWPLQLFNRGQGEAARAEAILARLTSDEAVLRQRLETELPVMRSSLTTRLATSETYKQVAIDRLPALLRVAETSYQEGESSIVSLLDAHQAAVDARLQYLDLAQAAWSTQFQLERLIGAPLAPTQRTSR